MKICTLNFKYDFIKNIFMLIFATGIAQIIPICFYPVLSRLFTPGDFGELATVTTVATIIIVVATGKYEIAILTSENKMEAINIATVALVLSIASISLLTAVFVVLSFLSESLSGDYLYFAFASAFAVIVYRLYNEWCVRFNYFIQLSLNKIVNSSAVPLSELGFAFISFVNVNNRLISGSVTGQFISVISCLTHFLYKEHACFKYVSWKRMRIFAKKHINCPKYMIVGQLLNAVTSGLPVMFIGFLFTQTEVGLFSMAMMVISVPTLIISRSVGDAFRQKAIEEQKEKGNCRSIFRETLILLTTLSFIGFGVLFFLMEWLFIHVLGEQWIETALYAKILTPMVAVHFISESLCYVYIVIGKLSFNVYWQIVFFVSRVLSLLIGYYSHDIRLYLLALMILSIFAYSIQLLMNYRFSCCGKQVSNSHS